MSLSNRTKIKIATKALLQGLVLPIGRKLFILRGGNILERRKTETDKDYSPSLSVDVSEYFELIISISDENIKKINKQLKEKNYKKLSEGKILGDLASNKYYY